MGPFTSLLTAAVGWPYTWPVTESHPPTGVEKRSPGSLRSVGQPRGMHDERTKRNPMRSPPWLVGFFRLGGARRQRGGTQTGGSTSKVNGGLRTDDSRGR